MKFNLLKGENIYWGDKFNIYEKNKIIINHENYRFKEWNFLKEIRDGKNPL